MSDPRLRGWCSMRKTISLSVMFFLALGFLVAAYGSVPLS